jgi:hypothetical protein
MEKKIYTSNDRAHEMGLKNHRDMIAFACMKSGEHWNGEITEDKKFEVMAFIEHGRWLVRCECENVMYAEPSDPIMFCNNCGNIESGGLARMVAFPANKNEIETALLEREIAGNETLLDKLALKYGASQTMLMPQFAPKILSRNWKHGETVEDLRAEHENEKNKGK